MNVVCLQKTVHSTGDLTLKIVHDDKRSCILSYGFTNTVDIGDNNLLNVLDHGSFI